MAKFSFLLEHGFHLVNQSDTNIRYESGFAYVEKVRYESDLVYVEIIFEERDYGVYVVFGRLREKDERIDLMTCVDDNDPLEAKLFWECTGWSQAAVSVRLSNLGRLLEKYGDDIFRADSKAYKHMRSLRFQGI